MKLIYSLLWVFFRGFHPPCVNCGSERVNFWMRAGALDCEDCGHIEVGVD